MKLLLEVIAVIILFAVMIVLVVILCGMLVIKTGIEKVIEWMEGKR